ncbi:hypothetical protein BBJ28_00009287 [Nothophytophthora sp. Chile5]|nr:hypothetical protein BBJ28_00009287 [Nothophytophthora sp. Chile5]
MWWFALLPFASSKPSYIVEFASAKRIRLSINFDPDHDAADQSVQMSRISEKGASAVSKRQRNGPRKPVSEPPRVAKGDKLESSNDLKVKADEGTVVSFSDNVKVEKHEAATEPVKKEKHEVGPSPAAGAQGNGTPSVAVASNENLKDVKVEPIVPIVSKSATIRKMDISMLCASASPSSDEGSKPVEAPPANPLPQEREKDGVPEAKMIHAAPITTEVSVVNTAPTPVARTQMDRVTGPDTSRNQDEAAAKVEKKESQPVETPSNVDKKAQVEVSGEDHSTDPDHARIAVIVGAKKRLIIDDDSSDSDSGAAKTTQNEKVDHPSASSPPPRKKRKPSTEDPVSEASMDLKNVEDATTFKSNGVFVNGAAELSDPVSKPMPATVEKVITNVAEKENKVDAKKNEANNSIEKATDAKSGENPSILPSGSPTEPPAAPEAFDITCESCKKCYDMRYLDPPLVERPSDEWRCFECLVNDARGWPRRRKSPARDPFSPRSGARERDVKKKRGSSSSRPRSGSSASKKTSRNSSKNGKAAGSASSKRKSGSSSSKRKASSSKSSSSRKSVGSSSSKKHKKRKSSSSSSLHHSSSHHHRRRHHNHHHEEFGKLMALFREQNSQRVGIENARCDGELQAAFEDAPQGWRVVSSTLDELRLLIVSLSDGSLEQDRLKGRLILILKAQETLEEQRRKQQELAWNILPRRQSSRIAIGKIRRQSSKESDELFARPVDPVLDGCPEYLSVIEHPIDLGTIRSRLEASFYSVRLSKRCGLPFSSPSLSFEPGADSVHLLRLQRWEIFKKDVARVWQNCRTFNASDTMVVQFADSLEELTRAMCATAEKKGVRRLMDAEGGGDKGEPASAEEEDVGMSSSGESKAESRSSVNKAWTESSASESSESSDDDNASVGGGSDSDVGGRKRRSTRGAAKKSRTRGKSANKQATRTTRKSRVTKKRRAKDWSSEEESSASEDEDENEVVSPVRNSRRPLRGSSSRPTGAVAVTPKGDSSDEDAVNSGLRSGKGPRTPPSFPPPPAPQVAQQRSKPRVSRLVISDSSSSEDSSDDDDANSSSSSDDSDSDAQPAVSAAKTRSPAPRIPEPRAPAGAPPRLTSAPEGPAPPPPPPPPPITSPAASTKTGRGGASSKAGSRSRKPKVKNAAGLTVAVPKAASTGAAAAGYVHSPSLLNSYLSPSSSSSSYFSSSGGSDSSDAANDSDSDSD